ncbi:MAG: response regulator transcription factor [Phycisphaerales bacterium]|nr:response regulator transcription factor [Phycisphaerales bacterium]
MKILIVDDEPPARDRLRELIGRLPDHEACAEAGNGAEAIRLAANLRPDIVLLDIQMPGLDGLETARQLAALPQPPALIFVTAYSEYALDAFDTYAAAYLLKPVRLERLEQALANAGRLNRAHLASLTAEHQGTGRTHVRARLGQRLELIPLSEVYYFQADQKYVMVRHRHGETLIEETLKTLEQELGTRLVRVHRNALAMVAQIAGLEKTTDEGAQLVFHGIPDRLEISRRHLSIVRQCLKLL